MAIEIRPLGVQCNLACRYCYQKPLRDSDNIPPDIRMDTIMNVLEDLNRPFTLYGGEALLVPLHILEEFWAHGYEKHRCNSIQTNGTLLNEEHIKLFKKFNVRVGISIDGPGALNDLRWANTLENTRRATGSTEKAIDRLVDAGINFSLIVTLHKINASVEKLDRMCEWFQYLDGLGLKHVRLHILEVNFKETKDRYVLTEEENIHAFHTFLNFSQHLKNIRFDIFKDMENLMKGRDRAIACNLMACDPYTTSACLNIEGDGQVTNCGRTNKKGINYVKSDQPGFERYIALYNTPQGYGGCQGCRFFLMCKGHCPGSAIDGDWRNRSEYCGVWMNMYEELEGRLLNEDAVPLSLDAVLPDLEAFFIRSWSKGVNPSLEKLLPLVRKQKLMKTFYDWAEGKDVNNKVEGSSKNAVRNTSDQFLLNNPGNDASRTATIAKSRSHYSKGGEWKGSSLQKSGSKKLGDFSQQKTNGLIKSSEFLLHEFVRKQWVSEQAKKVWKPRIERVHDSWLKIEENSVHHGIRPCILKIIAIDKFESLKKGFSENMTMEVLLKFNYKGDYTNRLHTIASEKANHYLVAIGRKKSVQSLRAAYNRHNDQTIGQFHGYPQCCRDFFQNNWVEHHLQDITWTTAFHSGKKREKGNSLELPVTWQTNLLWRWLGVRAIPHLPCSFDCTASKNFAERFVALGYTLGYHDEMDWLKEILSWPAEWSALHGIAEIITPILKLSVTTDYTEKKYVLHIQGNAYPEEGQAVRKEFTKSLD